MVTNISHVLHLVAMEKKLLSENRAKIFNASPTFHQIHQAFNSTHWLLVLILSRVEPVQIFSYSSKPFSCVEAAHRKTFVLMYETFYAKSIESL
jgi:hypothetical protein